MSKKFFGILAILFVIFTLGCKENKKNIPSLIQKLGSPNMEVADKAAQELQNIGKPALPHLITAINNNDPNIRKNAAFVLGNIGDREAVPPLMELLKDENDNVRDAAAWSLGMIGDKSALPALKDSLKTETDKKVKNYMKEAIDKLEK